MDIKEVKDRKYKLEKEVFKLLNEFESQTGVCVEGIELEYVHIRSILVTRSSINQVTIKAVL